MLVVEYCIVGNEDDISVGLVIKVGISGTSWEPGKGYISVKAKID